MDLIQGKCIWKNPKPYNTSSVPDLAKIRLELPNLVRFKDAWYCTFHEGPVHAGHPTGKARLIRSTTGESWETAAVFQWDGADIWDTRLSVTSEGKLMLQGAVWFLSREPRDDGTYYRLDTTHIQKTDAEEQVALQSVTWLSSDGTTWSSAYACPTGINSLKWDTNWHNGMGYSVGYYARETKGTLYRTRDGKRWRALRNDFLPDPGGNEAALAFGTDDTAYCLLRCGPTPAMLGTGTPPYYQDWVWRDLSVRIPAGEYAEHMAGGLLPSSVFFQADLGGPRFMRLNDGRLLAAARVRGPRRPGKPWRIDIGDPQGKEDGRIMLFLVDPVNAVMTKVADIDGTSYAGVIEHAGRLWVTYGVWWGDQPGIYMATTQVPD